MAKQHDGKETSNKMEREIKARIVKIKNKTRERRMSRNYNARVTYMVK